MNKNLKTLFLVSLFFSVFLQTSFLYPYCSCSGSGTNCGECGRTIDICCNSLCNGYPFLLPRSQGRNSARELVGWQTLINKYDIETKYGAFYIATEYQRSFWEKQIPRYFFGADYVDCKNLYIQGSQVQNRHEKAWLADYFGLPPDYDSRVSFCPQTQNAIVDFGIHIGLDEFKKGLYLKFNTPVAWTETKLCPKEKICNAGTEPLPAGYMATDEIPREHLASNFLQFMCGGKTFGDMKTPPKHGLITNKKFSLTRLTEIRTSLGYNFVLDQDYHFGFFFQLLAPGGNRPCAKHLFEPIVGNGKHWEIGGGLSGSWIFHRDHEYDDRYIGIWFDMTLTHLIHSCQCRSFDLLCKTNSRYMLLEQMGENTDKIQAVLEAGEDPQDASYQYQKNLIPAINLTTFNIDVRMDLQTDIAIKLGFVRENCTFDIGYNFWARTGEKFDINCGKCDPVYNYSIKGDTFIYGQTMAEDKFPLSATQSEATIYSGKNYLPQNDEPFLNPAIDNPFEALANGEALASLDNAKTFTINTSIDPILVSRRTLNLEDAPSALTHKIFAHFGYNQQSNKRNLVPFFGIGGSVEFARNRCKICCEKSKNNCCCFNNPRENYMTCDFCCDNSCNKRMGISQWGIWFKGGVTFY